MIHNSMNSANRDRITSLIQETIVISHLSDQIKAQEQIDALTVVNAVMDIPLPPVQRKRSNRFIERTIRNIEEKHKEILSLDPDMKARFQRDVLTFDMYLSTVRMMKRALKEAEAKMNVVDSWEMMRLKILSYDVFEEYKSMYEDAKRGQEFQTHLKNLDMVTKSMKLSKLLTCLQENSMGPVA